MRGLLLLIFATSTLFAQQRELESLEQLNTRFQSEFHTSNQRAVEYAQKNNIPLRQKFSDGTEIQLIDVDSNGLPLYLTTYNAGVAISTNVTKLRTGGGLNLNLRGSGMTVGVWDSGPVYEHPEFIERIVSREVGTSSDHGTHVTGTILATGLNVNAMGMAPAASLYSYDWTNDRAEMVALAKPDQSGLLFSNHSYGLVTGWNCQNGSCQWFGTPSISDKEDWRFGFYTSLSRDLDQIAFNAPYYSIFWAAGNDRDDFNNAGPYPQDGNQGSGYDCISQEGTAKNIFTIGAVRKVLNYEGPGSIEMSSFSGWGPTDDGRIKPDLVAPGVNTFSSIGESSYASQSGTSMATPGAMGSLLLLQELHRDLYAGQFMRSATLKALAIHTAKEAGQYPGPDYSYGWGLIDVEAAAKVLLTKDDVSVFVNELTLTDGQTYELELHPKENTKITATIAWTDPAGNPVANTLDPTDLMLVNDLDIRIVDEANNEKLPWAMNPELSALGEGAIKADNFRDNVEKLEFDNPEPRPYKLRINHKGTLTGGSQNFSLILTYTYVGDLQSPLYWVGGPGNFNDPNHWSLSSGGSSAGQIPTLNNRIVVDENSSLLASESIEVSEDIAVGAITWLNKVNAGIKLNGHQLTVGGSINFGSGSGFISSGKILLAGSADFLNEVITNATDFSTLDFDINTDEHYDFTGGLSIKSFNLIKGTVKLNDQVGIGKLTVGEGFSVTLDISGATLTDLQELDFSSTSLTLHSIDALLLPSTNAQIDLGSRQFDGKILAEASGINVHGINVLKEVEVKGSLKFTNDNSIGRMILHGNSKLDLSAGTTQTLSESVEILATESSRVILEGLSGKASLRFDGRFKLCFNYLDITSVDATGDAVINAGLSSTLINSLNWAKDECEDILFPDFETRNNCANGIVELIDKSGGDIGSWAWSTTAPNAQVVNEDEQNSMVVFAGPGTFEVSLTIANSNDSRNYKQEVTIIPNDLPANTIILNGLNMFSTLSSESYQWYRDYQVIPGATGRSFPFNGEPGTYFVTTKSSACNRVSNSILITDVAEDDVPTELDIFPNPASQSFTVRGISEVARIRIASLYGQIVYDQEVAGDATIVTTEWPTGMYLIEVTNNDRKRIQKLIIQ